MITSPSLRPRRPSSRCQPTRGPSLLLKHHPDQRIFRPPRSWLTIDLNYPSNNVLAVANIIPANDNSPSPPARACGWLHYILTFVNITNIRRLRYQLRLIHRCRAELRLCVCDRYGGEWNRDRRGRECDGYGRTCEWDGGLERGVGVCHVPHC
ncbi:hypothetical protein B0H11DRAFT_1058968 [Mycena galericulata]|nr:hypothetical protein B0H11DRAFT_1058968 [Mycena galericulata]